MEPRHSKKPMRHATKTTCKNIREWIKLGLATAAGIVFLCCCLDPKPNEMASIMSLCFCLILLGEKTLPERLISMARNLKQ